MVAGGHTRGKRKKIEKVVGDPREKLAELEEQAGLTQFRVVLQRRHPDGTLKGVKTFHQVPPDFITSMPDWVGTEFGGGNFEAYVTHPMDSSDTLFAWGFNLEGDPIEPKREPKHDPNNPFGVPPWQAFSKQQQVPHPWGAQMHGIGGFPTQQGPYPPHPYYQRPPESRRDSRLEQELDSIKRQNEDLKRQMLEQRHQAEMQRQQESTDRMIRELKSNTDQQIQALKTELIQSRKSEGGDTHQTQLFNMFMESSKSQQNLMQMMMTRESEASREQLRAMKDQMLEDIKFRREMYDRMAEAKDPKQAAAMLDMMGQQTASMMNLIQQAVTSGLLGGQEGDPAWLRAVQQGLESLKDFGNNLLAAKQREAAMSSMRVPPQPPGPRFPPPRPGFGQPQRQGPAPQGPARPAPGPVAPPSRVPGESDMPPGQEVIDSEPEQSPPSLIIPIQRFLVAMQEDIRDPDHEHTRVVAEMIYDFVDFLRSNDMMPPEWRGFYDDPAATVKDFLDTMVMPVNPEFARVDEDYLESLGSHLRDIIDEESGDEDVEVPSRPMPTPPVPPEEEPDEEPDEEPEAEPEE